MEGSSNLSNYSSKLEHSPVTSDGIVNKSETNHFLIKNPRTRFRGEFPIGVHYSTDKKKFVAQISKNDGQRTHLGLFNTPEEAFYVYKDAKETYIKEVAEKWKNLIDARVYEALINYKIDLGD